MGACGAWATGTEDIYEIFHFYPFGYQLRQRFSELGGPREPKFGMMVDLSSGLRNLFWISDKAIRRRSSKIRRSEDDWGRNLGQIF